MDMQRVSAALNTVHQSASWEIAVKAFSQSQRILYIGHGGNLAIADHAAIDCTRVSKGRKTGVSTGSAVLVTSIINDVGWENWLPTWMSYEIPSDTSSLCAIVLTSSGKGSDIVNGIEYLLERDIATVCLTARSILKFQDKRNYCELLLDVETYNDAEVLSLGLTYDLLSACGFPCPKIK